MTSDPTISEAVGEQGAGIGLDANDFVLFDVPVRYVQDRAVLDARWKALQMQVHPDRFASQGAAAQRVAMTWAIRVNEAYQRLKAPQARAAYLCELHGQSLGEQANTAMPTAFLMQQMAWREALDDARGVAAVEALDAEVAAHEQAELATLATLLDERQDAAAAAQQVRALMFVARFREDINRRLEALDA
jgi:molecular chaperone HscB